MGKSGSSEDYLKCILVLQKKNDSVRSIDIAEEQGLTKPSVCNAMKKLRRQKWIYFDEEGYIFFTIYKLYDMICFDYFLLMKYKFFQFYFPEVEKVYANRKYGYNIKSQLLKPLVIFPADSAIAARICVHFT